MDRLLHTTNIPKMFETTRFRDFDVERDRSGSRVMRLLDSWDPTDARPSVFLQGPPNKGKTMLMCALLHAYHDEVSVPEGASADAAMVLRQQRCPVFFVQAAALIAWNIRLFRLQSDVERGIRDAEEYLELDRLLQDLQERVQVLVIDDVGKEHRTSSGFAQDQLDLLVRTRHNNGLTTAYTTNLPLSRWSGTYSESMASLIERSSLVLSF